MVTKIVIHCSASPNDRDVTAEDIHQWHLERGWDGIGYHAVITRQGEVQAGRPLYWQGSHVAGHNADSIGICLIGNDSFSEEQMQALKQLLYLLKFQFQDADIYGHYELDSKKTCPNFNVKSWVETNMPGIEHTVRH